MKTGMKILHVHRLFALIGTFRQFAWKQCTTFHTSSLTRYALNGQTVRSWYPALSRWREIESYHRTSTVMNHVVSRQGTSCQQSAHRYAWWLPALSRCVHVYQLQTKSRLNRHTSEIWTSIKRRCSIRLSYRADAQWHYLTIGTRRSSLR